MADDRDSQGRAKSIEQALRESEHRFRILAENIPGLVYLCEGDERFSMIYINARAEELTGYPREDFLDSRVSLTELTHPEDKEHVVRSIEQALASRERFHVEYRARHRSGKWRWFSEEGVGVFRDGQMLYLEGYVRDITHERRAVEERQERIRLNAFAEHVSLAVPSSGHLREGLQKCAEEMVYHLDAALARIWTLNVRDQVLELQASAGLYTHIDGGHSRVPLGVYKVGKIARERKPQQSNTVIGDSGVHDQEWAAREGLVSFAGYPLVVEDELLGVLALFARHPLSEPASKALSVAADGVALGIAHKRAEQARREMELRLLHSQKLESLGVLAGGIAHDFNNLLVGILGNTGLALADLDGSAPIRPLLVGVERAAQRAADLARQMLAYSGKGQFVIEAISLNALVSEMGDLSATSRSKQAVLRYELGENLPPIEGDATQIRQVIKNLITNASDAIGEAEGVITISTGALVTDQESFSPAYPAERVPHGVLVYLEVADSGCGMDEATQLRVFDPFYSTKVSGRGLGLAAVIGIVRGHGGAIQIRSEPGKGSSFRVLFPSGDRTPESSRREPDRRADEWRASGTVLVVDDEQLVREVASACLSRAGFDVLEAADGWEAVKLFKERGEEIRLVLLDMTMPKLDGRRTFQELRRIRDDVAVVLTSGHNEQDAINRFSCRGLKGFLQKPYRHKELLDLVCGILSEPSGGSGS
ncbi:MAG: response regulator [Planctomycetota bacterium]